MNFDYNKRIILGVILIILIIGIGIFMYVNKEGVFAKYTKLFYPDGCTEEFKNGVAITKLCTRGRLLSEGDINGLQIKLNGTT